MRLQQKLIGGRKGEESRKQVSGWKIRTRSAFSPKFFFFFPDNEEIEKAPKAREEGEAIALINFN